MSNLNVGSVHFDVNLNTKNLDAQLNRVANRIERRFRIASRRIGRNLSNAFDMKSATKNINQSAQTLENRFKGASKRISNDLKLGIIQGIRSGVYSGNTILSGLKGGFRGIKNNVGTIASMLSPSIGQLAGLASMTNVYTAAIVGTGIAATKSVKMTSAFYEDLNAMGMVFEDNKERVLSFNKSLLETHGISTQQATNMAAVLGSSFKSAGIDLEERTEMTENLIKRIGDIASYRDLSVQQAFKTVQGALAGQPRGLREMAGIDITEASLREYAQSKGINENIRQMKYGEKVMLRYDKLISNSNYKADDFLKTQYSLANLGRSIGETWKEIGREFGRVIYPIAQGLLILFKIMSEVVLDLLRWLNDMFAPIYEFFGYREEDFFGNALKTNPFDKATKGAKGMNKALKDNLQSFDNVNNIMKEIKEKEEKEEKGGKGKFIFGGKMTKENFNNVKETSTQDVDALNPLAYGAITKKRRREHENNFSNVSYSLKLALSETETEAQRELLIQAFDRVPVTLDIAKIILSDKVALGRRIGKRMALIKNEVVSAYNTMLGKIEKADISVRKKLNSGTNKFKITVKKNTEEVEGFATTSSGVVKNKYDALGESLKTSASILDSVIVDFGKALDRTIATNTNSAMDILLKKVRTTVSTIKTILAKANIANSIKVPEIPKEQYTPFHEQKKKETSKPKENILDNFFNKILGPTPKINIKKKEKPSKNDLFDKAMEMQREMDLLHSIPPLMMIPALNPGGGGGGILHKAYAKGGIVKNPTLALLDEMNKSRGEAVLPLEKQSQWIKSVASDILTQMAQGSSGNSLMSQSSSPAIVKLNIDGRQFAEAQVPNLTDALERRGIQLMPS